MSLYSPNKARRSLLDTLTFRALSQVSSILGYIIFVRGMPKADFGVFNLLYSFIPVLGTVASFGLEQTLLRYTPEYLRSGNRAGALWLVRFIGSARFGLNVLLIGLVLVAWNFVAPLFHLGAYRIEFAYFSVLIILHFQVQILTMTLASHMLHRYSVGSVAVLSTGKLVGYLAMLYFGTFSLTHAILADTVAYALVFLFLRITYRRQCVAGAPREPYKPQIAERRRLFRYGLYNNFNDVGILLMGGAVENFFIAGFIDPISVGIYSFYGRLTEMATNLLPIRLFDNIIQPLFFSIDPADARARVGRSFTFLLNMNLILLWPMLAYSLVYHADIVTVLFGGKYVEFAALLPLMVLFALINSVATPVTLVAQYEEKISVILLSKVFVLYNLTAMVLLLPRFGIYGAMLARGSAETLKNLFIWWRVRKAARWSNFGGSVASATLVWGTAVGVCEAVKLLIPAPAILQMLFGLVLCGGAVLVYVRTPAIAASDRQTLASVFHGKEARILEFFGLMRPQAART